MGWVSNVEYSWEEPSLRNFFTRLSSFSRLIIFDKRGTGLSDRVSELPTLEQRMDDVRSVMDAAGSKCAALFGVSEGGPMCALFAATYPERTSALIIYASYARRIRDPEYPWAPTYEEREKLYKEVEENWGGPVGIESLAPSAAKDERFKNWWATYLRRSASPGDAVALLKMNTSIDIRNVLPVISVPALIIHRREDMDMKVEEGRYIAGRIPGAKFSELEGNDHIPWAGDYQKILDEAEVFLTGELKHAESERILATVMFTDIVGSTNLANELGDTRWHHLLQNHYDLVRKQLERFKGKEIVTTGDGFLATFDGPARAIRCACAIRDSSRSLGIEIRAGLHTGECELMQNNVGGIAVHTGARVMSKAGNNEVWVSGTVKDLVAGSGIQFESKGKFFLKGIPGEWELFGVSKY
ncbi:MAG: alpha/beta fold hydrolase [Sphingobacteriales bacterium]|nr:alpha/beta fold hydrolase [Sphingobacteriales bacterium]